MEKNVKIEFSPDYKREFMDACTLHTRRVRKLYEKHSDNGGTLKEFREVHRRLWNELSEKVALIRQKYGIPVDYEETDDSD
jgi:uncharacterized protein YhfF